MKENKSIQILLGIIIGITSFTILGINNQDYTFVKELNWTMLIGSSIILLITFLFFKEK